MEHKKRYSFPSTVKDILPNGLTLLMLEDHEQQGITIAFQMPVGEFCDPAGYEGIAELTISMILKGPENLTPEEFTDKLENVGSALFSEVGDEHCVLGCKMLSRYADHVIPLFWDMIVHPGFRSKELARLKREMITGLQAETADPMSIANRHFSTVLCGRSHPAGRIQSIRSVKQITLEHLKSFYNNYIAADKGVCVVAGDFDSPSMMSLIKKAVTGFSAKQKIPPVQGGEISPLKSTTIRLVDKPDLTQTSFILGHPIGGEVGIYRTELALANYVIGGGNFSSRLMAEIRSKEGKTYGISSQISCNRNFGVFSIATSTQNSQVTEMLSAIMKVYDEFAKNGITNDELAKAKRFAIGNMAFQLEGIVNVADKLLWLQQFERDVSYIEKFNEMVDSISIDRVNKGIQEYFLPNRFAIVAVGNKNVIQDILKTYGPVQVVQFRADPS